MENLLKSNLSAPKLRPIARKRHNYIYLFLSILFAISLGYLIKNFPPGFDYPVMNIGIPILPLFFVLIAGLFFSLLTFILIQKTQGIIVSFFVITFLLLRFYGFNHWIFAVIIISLFIFTEVYVVLKK